MRPLGGLGRQGATLQSGSGAEFSPRDVEETGLAPGSATRRRAPEAFLDFCDDLSGGDEQLSTTNQAWDDPQAQRCIFLWEFHQVQEEQPKNICGILAH